jgi:glycerol uptake facilitator protein
VQDRGLAAYIAELVGTFLLVFLIGSVITLYVAAGGQAQYGSDYAVIGLAQAFTLFGLIQILARVSGAHLNPAVTWAAALMRRIDPIDAVVYMLAQLSGGVLGALLVKGLLEDEGQATDYGALDVSPLLGSDFAGAVVEGLGTFVLVLAVLIAALSPKGWRSWSPLTIGASFGALVMVLGPLTGGGFNPARWFGPALVGENFGGVWPYLLGPLVGATLAAIFYKFVIAGREGAEEPERAPGT